MQPRRERAFTLIELLVVLAVISLLAALLFPVFSKARENAHAVACLSNMKQLGMAITSYLQDYDETYPMSRLPDATHPAGGCVQRSGGNYPSDMLEGTSVNWKRAVYPYVKNSAVFQCPSNVHAWETGGYNQAPGDETNFLYSRSQWLPNSYAYNGSFFHEAIPACWYGENKVRPRYASEMEAPATLILVLESRLSYPDAGDWLLSTRVSNDISTGPFQTHNGFCNWIFADQHAKRLKLAAICQGKMWTGSYPDLTNGCARLSQAADEYR